MITRLYSRRNQMFLDSAVCAIAWVVGWMDHYGTLHLVSKQIFLLVVPVAILETWISALMGTYRLSWRYVNTQDALALTRAYLVNAAVLALAALIVGPYVPLLNVPLGVVAAMFLLSTVGAIGMRMTRRIFYEYERRSAGSKTEGPQRFLIIGAGLHGITVAREMVLRKGIEVIGFLDDDVKKQGLLISRIPVLGPVADLARIATMREIDEVLVCISPQSRRSLHLENILTSRGEPLPSRIMPTLDELLRGNNTYPALHERKEMVARYSNGRDVSPQNGHGARNGDGEVAITANTVPELSATPEAAAGAMAIKKGQPSSSKLAKNVGSNLPVEGKAILITGGAGFIGSSLAEKLADRNRVILFDQTFAHSPARYTSLLEHPNVACVEGNILYADLAKLVKQADIVIHTAAMLGVNRVCNSARETLETNYVGTSRLLRALDSNRAIQRFVYFSTSEVFGVNSFRVDETSQPHIGPIAESRWSYAMSKLAGEHLVASYYRETRLPIVIVRPFNIFGPRRTGDYALRRFVLRALRNEPLEVYGDGTQIRSWCYIEDFCAALVEAIIRPEAIGEDFNVGSPGNIITIHDLARKVIELTGSHSSVTFRESPYPDISIRVPSLDKAKRLLGFQPNYDLETGLKLTIEWYKTNLELLSPQLLSVLAAGTSTGQSITA